MSNKDIALKIKNIVSNYGKNTGLKYTILKSINELFFSSGTAGGTSLGYNAITISDNVSIDNNKVSNILEIVNKDERKLGSGDTTLSFLLHFLEADGIAEDCNNEIGLPILDNLFTETDLTDFNEALFIAVFKDLVSKKFNESNGDNFLENAKEAIGAMFSNSNALEALVNEYYPVVDFSWVNPKATGPEIKKIKEIMESNKNNNNNFIFKIGNKEINFNKYVAFCIRDAEKEVMSISVTGESNERALIVLNNPGKVLKAGYKDDKNSFIAVKGFNDIYKAFKRDDANVQEDKSGFTSVDLEIIDGTYISEANETKFPYDPSGVLKIASAPGSNATLNINFLIDPFLNIVYAGAIDEEWDTNTLSLWATYEGRLQVIAEDDETADMNKYLSVLIASKVIRKFNKTQWIEDVAGGSVVSAASYYVDRGVDYTSESSKILKSIEGDGGKEGINGLARSTDAASGTEAKTLLKIINSIRTDTDIDSIVDTVIQMEETIKAVSSQLTSQLETSIKLCKIIKAFRENNISGAFEIIDGESKIEYKGQTQVEKYFNMQSGIDLQESKYRLGSRILSESFIKSSIQKLLLEADEQDTEEKRLQGLKDLKGKSDADLGKYWSGLGSSRVNVAKTLNDYVKKHSSEDPSLGSKKDDPFVDTYKEKFIPAMEADENAIAAAKERPAQEESEVAGSESGKRSSTTPKEKRARVKRVSAAPDLGEKQFEIDQGRVGTFLRASIEISSPKREVHEEQRVRQAIRSVLIKEETSSQLANRGVGTDQLSGQGQYNVQGTSGFVLAPTNNEVTDIVNMLVQPGNLGGTKWAIFSTFEEPDKPYYAICMYDPNNGNFKGAGFARVDLAHIGATKRDLLGRVSDLRDFPSADDTVIEFAIERVILNSITAFPSLSDMTLEWNTNSNAIEEDAITYTELGRLFKEKRFDDYSFENSIKVIGKHLQDRTKLYKLRFIETNAMGVLKSDEARFERAKERSPRVYKQIIRTLNKQMSDTLRPGETMKFNIIKRAGDSKNPKFKSDNKAHQDALNRKASNFGRILSFLGEIDLTGFRKQGSGALGRKITIPNTLEKYTSTIPSGVDSSVAHQQAGLASIEADNPAGFKILPMLNEKQFYAVLVNYYKSTGTRKRKASRGLKNFKSDYLDYKKKYKEEVTQKIIKAGLTKKEDLKTFEEETKRLRNKDNPSGKFEYYDVNSTDLELGGAKQMKGRERDTTEDMGRSFPLTYIHKPGVLLGDPYTNFIKDLLMSATKKTAAANNSYRDAKILESIVSRHEMLYEIYLKNKKKQKIKDIILEKYKSGDVMIGSLKSLARKREADVEPVDFETGVAGSSQSTEPTQKVHNDTPVKDESSVGKLEIQDYGVSPTASKKITSPPSVARRIQKRCKFPPYAHAGIDFAAAKNEKVYSTDDGVIYKVYYSTGGYGNTVIIKNNDNTYSLFAHFNNYVKRGTVDEMTSSASGSFKVGDSIKKGQLIGFAGETGHAFGSHVHYERRPKSNSSSDETAIYTIDWLIENENEFNLATDPEWEAIKGWRASNTSAEYAPVTGGCTTNPDISTYQAGKSKYKLNQDQSRDVKFKDRTIKKVISVVYEIVDEKGQGQQQEELNKVTGFGWNDNNPRKMWIKLEKAPGTFNYDLKSIDVDGDGIVRKNAVSIAMQNIEEVTDMSVFVNDNNLKLSNDNQSWILDFFDRDNDKQSSFIITPTFAGGFASFIINPSFNDFAKEEISVTHKTIGDDEWLCIEIKKPSSP
jgi:murein DD-endopeptidase MepM/ murein hydrolase activator NlpD